MRTFAYIVLLLVAAMVEATLPRLMGLGLMRPMLVIVVVIHFAWRLNTVEGAMLSFVGGFFVDAMAGYPTGLATFAAVATFVGVRVAFSGLKADGALFEALFAAVLTLLWGTVTLWVQRQLGPDMSPIEDMPWLAMGAWGAVATALATPGMMNVARRVERLEKRPAGWL